jgi:diaminopimelate epimerase
MRLDFVKMHGAGNDYIYINGFTQNVPDPADLARRLSPRHVGIGGDGVILLLPSDVADVRMRMFNVDGSEGQMCGNGVRCVAKLAHDDGLATGDRVKVETGRGVLAIDLQRDSASRVVGASVDMDEPILTPAAIPTTLGDRERAIDVTGPLGLRWSCVSMGNPHAVAFVDDLAAVPLAEWGPAVAEDRAAFPEGVNAHFVQRLAADRVRILHWERGSGPTLACGTGACAVCVAGVLTNRTTRQLTAEVPGGELQLAWDEASHHVKMTGPALEVFRGTIKL